MQIAAQLIEGTEPGFVDLDGRDYRPSEASPVVAAAQPLPAELEENHPLTFQYVPHRKQAPRTPEGPLSLGAYEPASR